MIISCRMPTVDVLHVAIGSNLKELKSIKLETARDRRLI